MNIRASPDQPHFIRYAPAQETIRDHLIAHECSHLIRFYSARPEERVVPVSTPEHRRAVAYELEDDLVRLYRQGLPPPALAELLGMWHEGIVRQVTNYPADLRIERWLRDYSPDLAACQEESLKIQLKNNDKVLSDSVRGATAEKVYRASATMNAAFARYVAKLLDEPLLAARYSRSAWWQTGAGLANEIWDSPDGGYPGDVRAAKEWSEGFALEDWYRWEIP